MASRARTFDQFADQLQLGRDPEAVRRRIEMLETVLERAIHLPVINRKVGADAILGLIPGVGDVITGLLGSYIVWEAKNAGVSKWTLARMIGNVGVDTAIGAIPFVGDLFDLAFRSNTKNLQLLRRHLDRHHPRTVVLEGQRA